LFNHLLSVVGVQGTGVEGAAGGVPQRLGWWITLHNRWTASAGTFLFGLGWYLFFRYPWWVNGFG
jgi:hypothetical protein